MQEPTRGTRSQTAQKFARTLLAGTCLTGAAGVASSATIIEGIAPAPADFSNTSLGFLLPAGTTQVDGTVTIGADNDDWFQFQNLLPLSAFSFSGGSLTPNYFDWAVYNTSLGLLGSGQSAELASYVLNGTVPADGILVVNVNYSEGNPYTASLTATEASAVPEPGTLGLAGLALGSALAWRRRRKQ